MENVWIGRVLAHILGEDFSGDFCSKDGFEKLFDVIVEETLTPREKSVLLKRYRDGKSLDAVGKEIGLTKERVRQILAKAERKIKHSSILQINSNDIRNVKLSEFGEAGLLDRGRMQQHYPLCSLAHGYGEKCG